jgi:hypothetical protein
MHVTLDIHLVSALDRQLRLQADSGEHLPAETIPLRARIALGLPRVHTRSETALARRRAGELHAHHG